MNEIMSQGVLSVNMNENIHDAYAMMSSRGYRHIVVVDEKGVLAGLASQGDFLRHIGLEQFVKFKVTKEVMNKSLLMIEHTLSLEEAASRMGERGVDYAIVTEDDSSRGMINERDITLCIAKGGDPQCSVTMCWHTDYPTIHESTPLQDAAAMMEQHGVHQLIVVDDNEMLVGLLGRDEVLQAIHGGYFEYLIQLVDEKSAAISKIEAGKRELQEDKELIEKSEAKLRHLFDLIPYGIVVYDMQSGLAQEFNARMHEQLGYSSDEFKTMKIADYEAAENLEEHQRHMAKIISEGHDLFETKHRRKDGKLIDIEVNVVHFFAGKKAYIMGVCSDITERKQKELELYKKDEALKAAQIISHVGSWKLNTTDNHLEWSDECYRIFGIEIGTPLTYEMFLNAIHPDDREKVSYAWNEALRGAVYEIEHRIIVHGTVEWVKEKAELEFDSAGDLIAGVGTVQLISERKAYEEQLEKMANYDPLTGLANRSLLLSHLQSEVDKGLRENLTTALILLDLDRFKDVNDSFGHQAGDTLLVKVAERLKSRMREGDLIARLGGDEFALILDNLVRIEDAGRITEEILSALGQEYLLEGGISIHVGASAGIVLSPNHGKNALELLQYADAALYRAKNEGRGIYYYYSDDLTDAARRRIDCETQLRRAIENEEFEVYYQPQVHMATGRIVGAEALVRWNDPARGLVFPGLFIPLAEETGLISKIGEWVLNEACRQGKIWLDRGYRLTLAVNLSAHQMRHQDIPKMVDQALRRTGYSAERLELELTESALMDREEEVVATLHTLRARGIRLAIDDFGTGYSSLSYLKRFPIDVLKIDKSFVDDIPFEEDDMAIVSAIIAMGKALGFQVLAEGTERQEQLDFLEERGCTLYQGYIKSPPLPAAEFEKLLG